MKNTTTPTPTGPNNVQYTGAATAVVGAVKGLVGKAVILAIVLAALVLL